MQIVNDSLRKKPVKREVLRGTLKAI